MFAGLVSFGRLIVGTLRDLAPIIVVIAFFQIVVLRQPFPDLEGVLAGLVLVMVGLALFIQGLEMGLFPLGESMAGAFARKGSLFWLLAFAFALGFGTTVVEPALITVAGEAAIAAAEAGLIGADEAARGAYAAGLLAETCHFDDSPGSGIAFQVDIEDAVGLASQIGTISSEIEDQI